MSKMYQSKLIEYLKASPITPGEYTPSDNVKSIKLAAVYVGQSPFILTGAAEDQLSVDQAKSFVDSDYFGAAIKSLGFNDELSVKLVDGKCINWPDSCEALVKSLPGEVEQGGDSGQLVMIILYPDRGFSTLLCVNTELARIIDPSAPAMDDGQNLKLLARQDTQILKFQ